MKAILYGAIEVATALKEAFLQTAQQAAQILKTILYGAVDVANALKNAFPQTAQEAAQILKTILYGAVEVATALKDAFFQFADRRGVRRARMPALPAVLLLLGPRHAWLAWARGHVRAHRALQRDARPDRADAACAVRLVLPDVRRRVAVRAP
jgi:hypothetical protein